MNLGTNAYKIVLLNWILRNAKSLAIQVFACSLLVALPVLHEPRALTRIIHNPTRNGSLL
jgi:hypothetical protein